MTSNWKYKQLLSGLLRMMSCLIETKELFLSIFGGQFQPFLQGSLYYQSQRMHFEGQTNHSEITIGLSCLIHQIMGNLTTPSYVYTGRQKPLLVCYPAVVKLQLLTVPISFSLFLSTVCSTPWLCRGNTTANKDSNAVGSVM